MTMIKPTVKQFNNWVSSVSAYADMSPDLAIRQQVNKRLNLCSRDSLGLVDWCEAFAGSFANQSAAAFVYEHFSDYSGIDFSLVRPQDRLHADLHMALVCWHDWVITFVDDFFQQFDIDLSDDFDEDDFETIGDMVQFLVVQTPQSISRRTAASNTVGAKLPVAA